MEKETFFLPEDTPYRPKHIIDFHTHFGDIFHENRNIAWKRPGIQANPPEYDGVDPFRDCEESGYEHPLIVPDEAAQNKLIDAGQVRIWQRANMFTTEEVMAAAGVDYWCSMPIMPNTSFEECLAWSKLNPSVIPWTCPDFDLPEEEMMDKLRQDIRNGAKGLKIHPIIQNLPITDPRCKGPIELFGELGMPITYHCGINDYYKKSSPFHALTNLEYGDLKYTLELLAEYPDFVWIPAHGGGSCGGELEALADIVEKRNVKNVYIECSHRATADMHKMHELFGEDRIMYADDWPFDTTTWIVYYASKAFADKPEVADKFFWKNAARILGMTELLA